MDGISNNTPTHLPYEIIETILLRLPVKSLFRFKCVRKQWNATISDPKFAQTHLQISKTSASSSLSCLLVDQIFSPKRAQIISFQNDEFTPHSPLDYPTPIDSLLCYCDGLYIIRYTVDGFYEYALWNPSRRSYKKLNKYRFDRHIFMCGMCYDPLLNDYKVVMADAKYYAVFYCRKNYWSDLREMNPDLAKRFYRGGCTPWKGSIYWLNSKREYGAPYEIAYFDGRDEKWKNLENLVVYRGAKNINLLSSGEDLYLFHHFEPLLGVKTEFLFMNKVGDGDDDDMVQLPVQIYGCGCLEPVLCSHENKILFRYSYGKYVVIYDVSKGSSTRVECPWSSVFGFGRHLFPYQENMFCD